ncbi:hypothetical protein [Streptomyces atratus]|uniref:Uncharacterized protein n=1 Tax=Streptomyces atratus TaxID=1893 RepID=A0A2Z5J7R9_STRAR|nr:hypothetical protein [Streptomyces atratus]AXE76386.1 hypothetical protein C5746_04865 [Streptomyces atratus]
MHTGTHIELAPGVAQQGTPDPAGWPYGGGRHIADRDDEVGHRHLLGLGHRVGEHRNGPTAIITVAFQGHYSRFVDMART